MPRWELLHWAQGLVDDGQMQARVLEEARQRAGVR